MIPIHKLEKLPRHHRLRKAAKSVGMAERTIISTGKLSVYETEYITKLFALLAHDENFSPAALESIKAAYAAFSICESEAAGTEMRRVLNVLYHLLMTETGRSPADWDFIGESGTLDPAKRRSFPGVQVYFDDVRSPFNVGSMFRTAESFGVEKIWLSPLCADPQHRRSERTAMGCVAIVPWERFSYDPFTEAKEAANEKTNPFSATCSEVPRAGPFFALETGGTPLEDFTFPQRGILIAGSEELGVSPQALAAADASLGL